MKLSRLIAGGIASLIAVQLVGAKIISNNIEDAVNGTVEAYSDQVGFPLLVNDFKNGWFSSSFNVSIAIPVQLAEPLKKIGLTVSDRETITTVDMQTDINHGPFIIDNGLHFGAAYANGTVKFDTEELIGLAVAEDIDADRRAAIEKMMPQLAKLADILESTYSIDASFNGDVVFHGKMEGGNFSLEDFPENGELEAFSFEIGKSTGSWQINSAKDHTVIQSHWEGLNFTALPKNGEKIEATVGAMTLDGELAKIGDAFWGGDATASIKSITVTGSASGQSIDVGFGPMDFASSTQLMSKKKDLLSSGGRMTLENFKVAGDEGALVLDSMIFDVEIQNLFTRFLAAYQEVNRESWNMLVSGQTDADPFAKFETAEFEGIVDKQLAAKPRITIADYKITSGGENVGFDGYIQLNPGATSASMQEGEQIWSLFEGEVTFRLSPKMVKSLGYSAVQMGPQKLPQEQIDQLVDLQLAQYQQMGLIKPDGQNFVSNVNIANDIISVNGKPMAQISQLVAASQQAKPAAATE